MKIIPDSEIHRQQKLTQLIVEEIKVLGAMPFPRFMELALYAPGLGYYMSSPEIFGRKGDFVTAPEISSVFSFCIARQIIDIFTQLSQRNIVEIGAGSGKMATDILQYLAKHDQLPEKYFIYEISESLKKIQQQQLKQAVPDFYSRIQWIGQLELPIDEAVIIGNEFLDALPCCIFYYDENFYEMCVAFNGKNFVWEKTNLKTPGLSTALGNLATTIDFENHYQSEINLNYSPLFIRLQNILKKGVILFCDYGYPQREYYLTERKHGTLKCFSQHQAYNDPLVNIGVQDITSHVDFTAVAEAANTADFALAGFTTQAHFLINCGLEQILAEMPEKQRLMEAQKIKTLIMPQEMGEIIKVIAFEKNMDKELLGFKNFDLSSRL